MVLEASFLCIDNSDYMRNGDFAPSRMEAQLDAVNLLSGAKTQSNPENTVGLLSTAGQGVEVQVTLTSDVGKILSLSHGIKIGGKAHLSAGIQVRAMLGGGGASARRPPPQRAPPAPLVAHATHHPRRSPRSSHAHRWRSSH